MIREDVMAEAIKNVRRYCELTLDSISVERRGMAEDVLSLLPEASEPTSNPDSWEWLGGAR